MKVFFIAYNIYGIGGTVRSVVNTANYLVANGVDVEIISVRRTSETPLLGLEQRVALRPLVDVRRGETYRGLSPIARRAKKLLLHRESRLVHPDEDLYGNFSTYSDLRIVRILRELRNCILVATIPSFVLLAQRFAHSSVVVIGQEHKEFTAHTLDLQAKLKARYKKLKALVCVTPMAQEGYSSILSGGSVQVVYIPNGTILPPLAAKAETQTVIAAGRLAPEKAFDRLVRAFAPVARQHPEWILKIFGDGSERDRIQREILEQGLHNNVFLMPKTNDLASELARADIYALSSENESFGMVLIEAMARGLPSVAFACEGPKLLVRDGYNGFLVNQDDLPLFSKRLEVLVSDHLLRASMSENALSSVVPYSMDTVGSQWMDLIRSFGTERP